MFIPGNRCDCKYEYQFEPGNTVVYWYENQPWLSFGASVCPQCRQTSRIFMRDRYEDCMQYFIGKDFTFITDLKFAPPAIVAYFEAVYSLRPLDEVELTPRLNKEVEELGSWLEEAPDEWITEMFATPETRHELPERWTDG